MRQRLGSEGTIGELECSRFNLAQLGSIATSAGVDVTIRIDKDRASSSW